MINNIKQPNVLLIKGGFTSSGVGEHFTEAMLADVDNRQITRFSTVTTYNELDLMMYGYPTTLSHASHSVYPIKSTLAYWKFTKTELHKGLSIIRDLIDKNDIDIVWIILNGTAIVQLASELSQTLKIPYVVHIWDTPEYIADQIRLDPVSKGHLLKQFDQALLGASLSVTVSESMGRIYNKRYNIPYKSMVFCPPKEAIQPFHLGKKGKADLKVVFAGSLYAYREWAAFLNAIEEHNTTTTDFKISVLCIGQVSRWAKKREFVTYEKLKPIEEASRVINKCDVAYLPYWMSKKYSYAVQTAFPSKMSLYVASGTPVFYHGPKISTPAEFLDSYNVGLSCHTLDSKEILKTLFTLTSNVFQSQYKTSQTETLEDIFNPKRCTEIFNESIQIALRA